MRMFQTFIFLSSSYFKQPLWIQYPTDARKNIELSVCKKRFFIVKGKHKKTIQPWGGKKQRPGYHWLGWCISALCDVTKGTAEWKSCCFNIFLCIKNVLFFKLDRKKLQPPTSQSSQIPSLTRILFTFHWKIGEQAQKSLFLNDVVWMRISL